MPEADTPSPSSNPRTTLAPLDELSPLNPIDGGSTSEGVSSTEMPSPPALADAPVASQGNISPTRWETTAPWILSITTVGSLVAIGLFLTLNVQWFKTEAFKPVTFAHSDSTLAASPTTDHSASTTDLRYRIYVFHLHTSMIKRSVALFTGFAVTLIGLGVSFYTLRSTSNLGFDTPTLRTRLVTASPGLIAVVVGAIMVLYTVSSKDVFSPIGLIPSSAETQLIAPASSSSHPIPAMEIPYQSE